MQHSAEKQPLLHILYWAAMGVGQNVCLTGGIAGG